MVVVMQRTSDHSGASTANVHGNWSRDAAHSVTSWCCHPLMMNTGCLALPRNHDEVRPTIRQQGSTGKGSPAHAQALNQRRATLSRLRRQPPCSLSAR
jgi:hypothetical protein